MRGRRDIKQGNMAGDGDLMECFDEERMSGCFTWSSGANWVWRRGRYVVGGCWW